MDLRAVGINTLLTAGHMLTHQIHEASGERRDDLRAERTLIDNEIRRRVKEADHWRETARSLVESVKAAWPEEVD